MFWDIPYNLRGQEVCMGCSSIVHNNENHNATIVCEYRDSNNNKISDPTVVGSAYNTLMRKYTIPENATNARLYFRIAQNVGTINVEVNDYVTYNNFYIQYPSNILQYQPYKGSIHTIDWSNDIGIVPGGYIDLINGKLVQTYGSMVLDGTEDGWSTYGAIERNDFCAVFGIANKKRGNQISICDKLKNVDSAYAPSNYASGRYSDHPNLKTMYFCMPNTEITTITGFKQWLSENNLQLVYKLEEPVEYQLSPQTLRTLRGTNNIWSNANGPVEIKYWTH